MAKESDFRWISPSIPLEKITETSSSAFLKLVRDNPVMADKIISNYISHESGVDDKLSSKNSRS